MKRFHYYFSFSLVFLKNLFLAVLLINYFNLKFNKIYGQKDNDSVEYITTKTIEEIEIIGQRNVSALNLVSKSVNILSGKEINLINSYSFDNVIDLVPGIDIRSRGNMGAQSDISIRGGTFDHSIILLNGISMTDPQTGHFNLDLPIESDIIKKIEVINGSSARAYGSNALSGVINVVAIPDTHNYVSLKLIYGEYNLKNVLSTINFNFLETSHILNISQKGCDGYIPNTDFDILNIFYSSIIKCNSSKIELQMSNQKKNYGANGFYSPKFFNQYEETETSFASIKLITGEKLKVIPSVYWRRKTDYFILKREDPDFYKNFHLTDIFGSQLNMSFNSFAGITSFGFNNRNEILLSNKLGEDIKSPIQIKGYDSVFYTKQFNRMINDIFFEHNLKIKNLNLLIGFLINNNSDHPEKFEFLPGFDIGYNYKFFNFFFNLNKAKYLPTFTDLYYYDPDNQGNVALKTNKIEATEIGFRYQNHNLFFQSVIYYNNGKDIIEWLWSKENLVFMPVNLKKYISKGFETSFTLDYTNNNKLVKIIRLNYSYNDLDKSLSDTSISKYNHLKHKFNLLIQHKVLKSLLCSWNVQWQNRFGQYVLYDSLAKVYTLNNYKPYWLMDVSLSWNEKWYTIFFNISNILDTKYVEAGSLIQPGRWANIGLKIFLNFNKRSK